MWYDLSAIHIKLRAFSLTRCFDCPDSSSPLEKADCHKCRLLTVKDYTDMMWTTVAEFPGIVRSQLLVSSLHFVTTILFSRNYINHDNHRLCWKKKDSSFRVLWYCCLLCAADVL